MALDLFATRCRNCESAVPALAASCARCGAPNAARLPAFAIAGSVLVLIVAIAFAAFVILRGTRSDGTAGPKDDFAWLADAMAECDAEATKTPSTLHFLVVPMASNAADESAWRAKSRNDIGNAILLTQQVTLDALKGGGLWISSERYDFRIRDEATKDIYKWTPSTGIKKFLTPNAERINNFKVQFKTDKRLGEEWGATFVHERGTCYWVNAIIGN
jgi:hypothetical protein